MQTILHNEFNQKLTIENWDHISNGKCKPASMKKEIQTIIRNDFNQKLNIVE